MVAVVSTTVDQVVNVADVDTHARVIEQFAIHLVEKFAVPGDDFRQEFRDIHDGVRPREGEHSLEGEAEAEPADEDARPGRKMRAGESSAICSSEDEAVVLIS